MIAAGRPGRALRPDRWIAAVTLAGDGRLPSQSCKREALLLPARRRPAGDVRVSALRLLLLGAIGLVTGVINTVAGGGSLLSFPALLALGYSPLVANVTNTFGVFPSSAGGALGYRRELAGQRRTWLLLAAVCTAGSLIGAWLLLVLPASSFEAAVPVLIATAALLTLAQPWLARRMRARSQRPAAVPAGAGTAATAEAAGTAEVAEPPPAPVHRRWALLLAVLLISVYGGYFGAAIGVLLIAVLGLFLHDSLQRNNALKTSLTVVVNGVAAATFSFLGPVVWSAALTLALATGLGGMLGAVIARRLSDRALRWAVVAIGLAAAVYSAVR
jgi:uncharacterized membrane protein YfcA